jgi:hypothetical protein
LIVLGIVLAGCGRDSEEDASDAASEFLTALSTTSGEDVCAAMTIDAQDSFEATLRRLGAGAAVSDCEQFVDLSEDFQSEQAENALNAAEVEAVEVDGETAKVSFDTIDLTVELIEVDGEWKIDEATGRDPQLLTALGLG